jgi:hypothetical protein
MYRAKKILMRIYGEGYKNVSNSKSLTHTVNILPDK